MTSAIITLWNHGTESIRAESILKPITITVENSNRILEAKILRTSRPATEFALDQSRLGKRMVLLKWDILEPDDGAVIQIIYDGGPKAPIKVIGAFQGDYKITKHSLEKPLQGPLRWFLGLTITLLIVGNIYRNVRYRKTLYLHLEIINWICLLIITVLLFIYPNFMRLKLPISF